MFYFYFPFTWLGLNPASSCLPDEGLDFYTTEAECATTQKKNCTKNVAHDEFNLNTIEVGLASKHSPFDHGFRIALNIHCKLYILVSLQCGEILQLLSEQRSTSNIHPAIILARTMVIGDESRVLARVFTFHLEIKIRLVLAHFLLKLD